MTSCRIKIFGIFLLLLTCISLLVLWRRQITTEELVGTYVADKCYGIDTLFIRADFTYLHHFVSEDGRLCVQGNLWEYEDQYIGFWNFHLQNEQPLFGKPVSIWGVKPERCFFGMEGVRIPLAAGQDCYYKKI